MKGRGNKGWEASRINKSGAQGAQAWWVQPKAQLKEDGPARGAVTLKRRMGVETYEFIGEEEEIEVSDAL